MVEASLAKVMTTLIEREVGVSILGVGLKNVLVMMLRVMLRSEHVCIIVWCEHYGL